MDLINYTKLFNRYYYTYEDHRLNGKSHDEALKLANNSIKKDKLDVHKRHIPVEMAGALGTGLGYRHYWKNNNKSNIGLTLGSMAGFVGTAAGYNHIRNIRNINKLKKSANLDSYKDSKVYYVVVVDENYYSRAEDWKECFVGYYKELAKTKSEVEAKYKKQKDKKEIDHYYIFMDPDSTKRKMLELNNKYEKLGYIVVGY